MTSSERSGRSAVDLIVEHLLQTLLAEEHLVRLPIFGHCCLAESLAREHLVALSESGVGRRKAEVRGGASLFSFNLVRF